ncbi:MAG: DUF4384 domain-containing protein [Treponema sp.]|jgi:hypothetical protein|nr:DUF4384 domain-containing protein [Treponema sp.]
MRIMKRSLWPFVGGVLFSTLLAACGSREPALRPPLSAPALRDTTPYPEDGVSLDQALSDIAAYYAENLPPNTRIALLDFESEARLLSDYIFEELWIRFENGASFVMVERHNLELIQKELDYQYSGAVSDESALSVGNRFGPQTLVYGKITRLGRDYRLVVHATDAERAVTSIRSRVVVPGPRFAALLENPPDGPAGMAGALYSGAGNPWPFTVRTDRPGGNYRDGDYMTLRIYSEKDAWFKVTHVDVNGNAQVIYPLSPRDNNFIQAGETRQIPDNTRFRMTRPYGEEMILACAYERPFTVQGGPAAPLSNRLLVRGITVESKDTHTDMRPAATAKFTCRIGP